MIRNITLSTADEAWKVWSFKDCTWNKSFTVPTTTIDLLVSQFGVPDFCKIDVEGYELHVLKGMTKPIPYLCLSLLMSFLDEKTKPCLEYLHSLGYNYFNVVFGENDAFYGTGQWVDMETLFVFLKNQPIHSLGEISMLD